MPQILDDLRQRFRDRIEVQLELTGLACTPEMLTSPMRGITCSAATDSIAWLASTAGARSGRLNLVVLSTFCSREQERTATNLGLCAAAQPNLLRPWSLVTSSLRRALSSASSRSWSGMSGSSPIVRLRQSGETPGVHRTGSTPVFTLGHAAIHV